MSKQEVEAHTALVIQQQPQQECPAAEPAEAPPWAVEHEHVKIVTMPKISILSVSETKRTHLATLARGCGSGASLIMSRSSQMPPLTVWVGTPDQDGMGGAWPNSPSYINTAVQEVLHHLTPQLNRQGARGPATFHSPQYRG